MSRLFLMCLLLSLSFTAAARVEAYLFEDPVQEARYKKLIDELRCLVCQNQNLADSNAELAQDMRSLTYDMVRDGRTNEEIVSFMVARYGDFVMYRPPFKTSTALLWIGPFIILVVGVLVLLLFIRGRAAESSTQLDDQEHERAKRLLDDTET